MSAHQMVCHLIDSARMAIGEKAVSPASSLLQRTAVKWLALYVPLRWPPGIDTRPELDQIACAATPRLFPEEVAELVRHVGLLTTRPPGVEWPPHPIFGPLSAKAWLRWGYLHTDHHLRQFGV